MILLFLCTCFMPCTSGIPQSTTQHITSEVQKSSTSLEDVLVTSYIIGIKGKQIQQGTISREDAETLNKKILTLQTEIACNPTSETAQQLQQEIIWFAEEHHLLPSGIPLEKIFQQIRTYLRIQSPHSIPHPLIPGKASEFLCNFATTGSGATFPIIILPRLIPILLMPIPRAFIRWSTPEGITSVGGLRSGTGFIAIGDQKGIALGFWGIGFSIFLPPIAAYGLFGYAFYAQVTAEEIEYWPPNNPPIITGVDPADGEENVPLSTSELRFQIEDPDGDLMSYTVTTEPDIGSGSGGLKPDGLYTIPISGLQSLTQYTWHLLVNDGKDTIEKTLIFVTEPVEPVVSNPTPSNGMRDVSIELSQLQFTLADFQGDTMDYTVETSPNIGSGSGIHVGNGTYTIPVNGLTLGTTYQWLINVTDGTHLTRKIFTFETEYPTDFDPFDYGWQYRKQLTIDHTKVEGNLTNFPILVNLVDLDLREKAQIDGDDILFMNKDGVAAKLNHEIETYESSSGDLICWVNLPIVLSTSDTIFYVYYGNERCLNKENVTSTWDSNYKLVYHLDETSGSSVHDSTKNNLNGINYNSIQDASGKIDGGNEFDGDSDYIDHSDFDLTHRTAEIWINFDFLGGEQDIAFCMYDPSLYTYAFGVWGHQNMIDLYISGEQLQYPGTGGQWYHIALTYNYSSKEISAYINGVSIISMTAKASYIARALYVGYPNINCIDGKLDEVRFSTIVRSPAWIKTEYNNQNNPSSFLSYGPEEPKP